MLSTSLIGLKSFTETCDLFRIFSSTHVEKTNYCDHLITGAHHPQFNYIYNLKIDNLNALAEELAKLKSLGLPMVILCEAKAAKSIDDFFESRGYSFIGAAQSKQLSLDSFFYNQNTAIRIEKVTTEEKFNLWREIAAIGFGYPTTVDEKLFSNFLNPGAHLKRIKLYLAYFDGKAVGQSMLILGKQISMNSWSSVLPEYRKKGVLTTMIAHRLHQAQKLGYDTNVVQCMPMSAPIYDKFGYQNEEVLNFYTMNSESILVHNL